jgi:hypothetical protein
MIKISSEESTMPTNHLNHVGLGAKKTNSPKRELTQNMHRKPKLIIKRKVIGGPNSSSMNSKNFFISYCFIKNKKISQPQPSLPVAARYTIPAIIAMSTALSQLIQFFIVIVLSTY